jgi:hypothetical protein
VGANERLSKQPSEQGLLAPFGRITEQLGQIQWKYSDPTRRISIGVNRPRHSSSHSDGSMFLASGRKTGKYPSCRLFGHAARIPLSVRSR